MQKPPVLIFLGNIKENTLRYFLWSSHLPQSMLILKSFLNSLPQTLFFWFHLLSTKESERKFLLTGNGLQIKITFITLKAMYKEDNLICNYDWINWSLYSMENAKWKAHRQDKAYLLCYFICNINLEELLISFNLSFLVTKRGIILFFYCRELLWVCNEVSIKVCKVLRLSYAWNIFLIFNNCLINDFNKFNLNY